MVVVRNKILSVGLLLFVAVLLTGCNGTNGDEDVIYTTTYPIEFLVNEIAGDTVTVKRVPGSQTHSESIDWTPKEIIDMIEADILFYVDAGLDSYIPNNVETFDDGDVKLVSLEDAVTYNLICATHDHDHEEGHEEEEHTEELIDEHDDDHVLETCEADKIIEDPHFWLDPVRMLEAATFIKDQLVVEYPNNEEAYTEAYNTLKEKLETLHEKYQMMADEATKPIITTSLLFSYFEARYGIEIISMSQSTHVEETIPGDIIEIVEEALFHNINYIMYEKNINNPAGDALYNELNVDDYDINKGYLHGLGNLITEEIEQGETYLTIMYDNLETLKAATK